MEELDCAASSEANRVIEELLEELEDEEEDEGAEEDIITVLWVPFVVRGVRRGSTKKTRGSGKIWDFDREPCFLDPLLLITTLFWCLVLIYFL